MKKYTEVLLREKDHLKKVAITNLDKPIIESTIIDNWQRILNIVAKILDVPASLIMHITKESMEVFVKSQNPENPYKEGASDTLGHGLYCETVIGEDKELYIDNALEHAKWEDNPDVSLNMISYYGLPIKWPDEEFFGTLCVLDNKTNTYNEKYRDLLKEFKIVIENDLERLLDKQKLEYYAQIDLPTESYNRNTIELILKNQFERSKRFGEQFSVTILDINGLKIINDQYGHVKGDEVIEAFANAISKRIRATDLFGRWGGDEFLIISPQTKLKGTQRLLEKITDEVDRDLKKVIPNVSFCYGYTEYKDDDENYREVLKRADEMLYECKREYKK